MLHYDIVAFGIRVCCLTTRSEGRISYHRNSFYEWKCTNHPHAQQSPNDPVFGEFVLMILVTRIPSGRFSSPSPPPFWRSLLEWRTLTGSSRLFIKTKNVLSQAKRIGFLENNGDPSFIPVPVNAICQTPIWSARNITQTADHQVSYSLMRSSTNHDQSITLPNGEVFLEL